MARKVRWLWLIQPMLFLAFAGCQSSDTGSATTSVTTTTQSLVPITPVTHAQGEQVQARQVPVVSSVAEVNVPPREWTDATGKFKTTAILLDSAGGGIYPKKDNGSVINVPIGILSQADQEYVYTLFPPAFQLIGKVVGVSDGDTITVLDESNKSTKVRLEGIDAPESGQDFGTQAKKALSDKVFGKDTQVEWREKDKYGRTLGHVFIDGHWINKERTSNRTREAAFDDSHAAGKDVS